MLPQQRGVYSDQAFGGSTWDSSMQHVRVGTTVRDQHGMIGRVVAINSDSASGAANILVQRMNGARCLLA